MTAKDYRKIAEVLREGKASEAIVEGFVQMLQADNEGFDASRFKVACEI